MGKYQTANNCLKALMLPPHHRENFINFIKNPYTRWEDEKKVIFIHIPKAAGKTISYSLLGAPNGTGHQKLYVYERYKEKYRKYFKFTFIRNPWDRIVSAFFYMKGFDPQSNDRDFFDRYIGQETSFEEFINRLSNPNYKKLILSWEHFTPQTAYMKNRSGNIDLDFIGRVENINDDFAELSSILRIDAKITTRNAGVRTAYRDYYSGKMKEIVSSIYPEDIGKLNYKY
ncbi:sulfotransferase family 2 domain-containing protein [Pseudomonas sp. NY15364]|uniref:sulfotransferase family 2 domain-containing protein n=1 Tax=Pseudomonas sp. NY15364 TaxID=3400353 RepID=UPI003A8B9A64